MQEDARTVPNASPTDEAASSPSLGLLLLFVVYMLNYLDRQILSILKEPIAADLHLSDTQLGLLGGFAFAMFYTVLAIPAARLADRFSRVWVITAGFALWSGFTALCGMAGTYLVLLLARMGVGVGEACGVAPSYSLVTDYFPPRSQARALAIYSLGAPIGSAAGVLLGGLMAKVMDWRFAFVAIGVIGLLLAPILRLLARDPPRQVAARQLGLAAVARLAASKPTFWLLAVGAGCSSLVLTGLFYWLPTFLARSLHMDILSRSELLAAVLLIAGVIGMSGGGWLADRLATRDRRIYALIPASAFFMSAPLFALAIFARTPLEVFTLLLLPLMLSQSVFGPALTAVLHLSPASSRSTMSALFLLLGNLIGIGIGPYFFGKVSDLLKPQFGADSIKYAFLYGLGIYWLAALLMYCASRSIARDWVEH